MDAIAQRTQLAYDQIAPDFAATYAAMPPNLAALADRLARHVGPRGAIADIGCGHGRDTAWLERTNHLTIGFDLSFQMLRQARTITHGNLVQMDMRQPAVPNACFDGIWCCASLLHLPKSQVATALIEFRRIIRAQGMLILSIQEGNSEGWVWSERDHVERYFARYSISEMSERLARAGFAIHEQTTAPGVSARWLEFVCIAI